MTNDISYEGMLKSLSSPARNALLYEGIDTYDKFTSLTEKQVLAIHGIGKASLPTFHKYLELNGLSFKK